ncbi:MAG: alpha/beta fold hydrolase [Pseudomonadota bacterium]|nr:alpha/beta fold hydrolase [Pseudomonadota bacterium]
MQLNHVRRGSGRPLLLVHGLGGTWRSWSLVLAPLAAQRDVIALDLPGFGASAPLDGEVSIRTLADAVSAFISEQALDGVDAVGSSLGGRIVLELARRGGVLGAVVALDPGGFWQPGQRHVFFASGWLSILAVRALRPLLPALLRSPTARRLLLVQVSARPAALPAELTLEELRGYAAARSTEPLLYQLAYREPQLGAPRGSITHRLVIGWGRADRICPPSQALRAVAFFADARLHWFECCGHFPQWDSPDETVRLILETTEPAPSTGS